MNFLGPDLLALLEEVLPARFGGAPTDYQLAEREDEALPWIEVVVAPRLGRVDEQELTTAVLDVPRRARRRAAPDGGPLAPGGNPPRGEA